MNSTITYDTLDTDRKEIRVLVLAPGPEDAHDVLQCELRRVSLEDYWHDAHNGISHAYETISYCWGNVTARSQLHIGSVLTDIPRNTELAIRSMRLPDKERLLWIDAVCINQDDVVERSQQVSIMADVYRKATRNLVYLGEADEYTESALQSVDLLMRTEIAEAIVGGRSLIDTLYSQKGGNHAPVWATSGLTVPIDQPALNAFYQRPWFRRLWVVQEVAMATGSTGVCGSHTFDILHVLMVAKWLQFKYAYVATDLRLTVYAPAKIFNFADPHHSFLRSARIKPNLLYVMDATREFEYTEPLDVVYAVTGLIDWREVTVSEKLPTRLQPDYSRTLSQLLTNAAHIVIFSQSYLQLLDEVSHRSVADMHLDGLPSWVPRWHRKRDSIADPAPFQLFDASDGTPWMSSEMDKAFDTDLQSQMTVDGFRLGTITKTFPPEQDFDWSTFHDDFVVPAQEIAETIGENLHSVGNVLTAGAWCNGEPIEPDQLVVCQEICSELAKASNALPQLSIADGPPHDDPDEQTKLLLEGKQAMLNACNRRMICETESNLLCLVPDIAEVGDILVLLFRGSTPFVLRPVGGLYQVVGPCYVHGKMHGETVEEWKGNGSPDRTFTLI